MTEIDKLVRDLGHPGVPLQFAVLLGCLVLAWALCWGVMGGRRSHVSVWFGRNIFDGLLFPLVALALTYAALVYFASRGPAPLLRIAVPVLVSLGSSRGSPGWPRCSGSSASCPWCSTKWRRSTSRSASRA